MEEWKEYELSELIDEISMGPFGSNIKVECFTDSGVPVLNGSNLVGLKLNEDKFNYVTEEKAASLGKSNAYRNDIVITHRGTLGQIVYIPQDSKYEHYVISQSQFRVKCNQKVLPEYLVYYFHTRIGQHQLLSNASQVGVPALARPTTTFQKLRIVLPPLANQQKIARILSSLDDKIELNNKINANLEEQAQALFKNWFVDKYDKDGVIGDYCTVKSGFAFKSAWWQDKGIKVIRIGDIEQGCLSLETCAHVTNDKTDIAKDFLVHGGDLVIAMTGATIGKFSMIPKTQEPILVNQRVGKFFLGDNPIEKVPFIYCTLKQEEVITEFINRGQGSAQPNISTGDILSIPCWIPSDNEIDNFNKTIQPMFETIISNQEENRKLSGLRDSLLPKLMSDEIEVGEVII